MRYGPLIRLFSLLISLMITCYHESAQATPSFARQTGEACATCHMQAFGPWLTEEGIKFKLNAYTAGDKNQIPTLLNNFAAEVVSSVTNTQQSVPVGTYFNNSAGSSNSNNNVVNDWDSIFYAGRLTDFAGSYIKVNFDPQIGRSIALSKFDVRASDSTSFENVDIVYGISANNAPTMSDFWMSTPAWMYPYNMSMVSPMPVSQNWLQGLVMGGNTAGVTLYTMVDNRFYFEAGGYTSQSQGLSNGLGTAKTGSMAMYAENGRIVGGAPYYRFFYQQTFDAHWLEVGTYGFSANVAPNYNNMEGYNSYTEYNVDVNYSYMADHDNWWMAMLRYTRDNMSMSASQKMMSASNSSNYLDSVMLMAMWTYQQTYNLSFTWNYAVGSSDCSLYNGGMTGMSMMGMGGMGGMSNMGCMESNMVYGSANGSPNTNSFLVALDYIPFGKKTSLYSPYLNLRLSLQYLAYTEFNGSATNYDGHGRSAEANNTFYFVSDVAF
jgi:hypothetical protein